MAQSLIEKIAQSHAAGLKPGELVYSGDMISIRPAHVMTHDNTHAVMDKFQKMGATRMADSRQPVFTLDHQVQDLGPKNQQKYAEIEAFAREMEVDFYPAGRGIGHQIMCEEGYVRPGWFVVASDSHANMYGGLGALGTPVVRTDAAAIWATSQTWWRVPPVTRVILKNSLKPGVSGKDLILTLISSINQDQVLNHALEFHGDGVAALTIDQRLTIANMTTEWGALAGVFPADERTFRWLGQKGYLENRLKADKEATYVQTITVDLATVAAHVTGPDEVKISVPASDIAREHIRIHKAYLLSCVNSREEDLAEAARVIQGKQVAPGVEFYIAAASSEVEKGSKKRGDWQALIAAGARELPPGCGPCIGLGAGLLGAGEVGISATNRNFKGRMGDATAKAYLASPAVVAASAVAGYIDTPYKDNAGSVEFEFSSELHDPRERAVTERLEGFPEKLAGRLVFCPLDNLNTDGIYPGKYTYQDDFSPEQQAAVVMENYDPQFRSKSAAGDILVGGFNFGTGSSREQSVTALKHAKIQALIAGSFSATYARNAFNNGFTILESPELVSSLQDFYGCSELTRIPGQDVVIDFKEGSVEFRSEKFAISSIGIQAQQLILAGGLENWIKKKLKK